MSSSEQAPEPTMDEILASIRKIIADDDESSAPAPEASPEPVYHDAGNSELAGDIASVMGHEDASGEAEDDIFDLTHQVDEPAPQPSPASFAPPLPVQPTQPAEPHYATSPQPAADPFAAPSAPEAYAPPPATNDMPPPPEPSFPVDYHPESEGMSSPDASGGLSGAPMEESALPESATGFGAGEFAAPAVDSGWQTHGGEVMHQPETSSEVTAEDEAAEVADLDNFSSGQAIGAGDRVHEAFAESDVVAATGAPQTPDDLGQVPGDMAMGAQAGEFGAEPELAEPAPEPVAEAPDPVIVPPAPEPPLAEEAQAPAEEAEAGNAADEAVPEAAAASRKSLEDSVKEMLRPMLREWLDDNMPRIVESAVRDELQNKHNQF